MKEKFEHLIRLYPGKDNRNDTNADGIFGGTGAGPKSKGKLLCTKATNMVG